MRPPSCACSVERAQVFIHTRRMETNELVAVLADAERGRLRAALTQRFGLLDGLHLSVSPLRGGLASPSVRRVRARYRSPPGGRAASA
jgi:hypothetical protein